MTTLKPVPLTCADGVCSADIPSFCLQEHRRVPDAGTAYILAKNAPLTLSVAAKEGRLQTLPIADKVSIRNLRGFMSVSVSLPEAVVKRLGGGKAALSIGPLASAIPAPIVGDRTPLSINEIASFTGPVRQLAEVSL